MATLPRGWRRLHAFKPGRSAHPYEDAREAANPRLPPLTRASRGVACGRPGRGRGSVDGGEAAGVSEGAGALQLSGPKVRSSASQLHNDDTVSQVMYGVFCCTLGNMQLHLSTSASWVLAVSALGRTIIDL